MFGITKIVKGYSIQTYFLYCYAIFISKDITRQRGGVTFGTPWMPDRGDISMSFTHIKTTLILIDNNTTRNLVICGRKSIGLRIVAILKNSSVNPQMKFIKSYPFTQFFWKGVELGQMVSDGGSSRTNVIQYKCKKLDFNLFSFQAPHEISQ